MNLKINNKYTIFRYILLLIFIFFYPMLISIYVFPPLLVGVALYIFVDSVEKNSWINIFLATIYTVNIEINLNLPLFLMLIVALIFYITIFPYFNQFGECRLCKSLLSVVLLDFIYLAFLLLYDFIFQVQSIIFDNILLYSLVVDILMVMLI